MDKKDKAIEKTIGRQEAEIINGAIINNENGLYIPPVKYRRKPNCNVSNKRK